MIFQILFNPVNFMVMTQWSFIVVNLPMNIITKMQLDINGLFHRFCSNKATVSMSIVSPHHLIDLLFIYSMVYLLITAHL